MRKFCQISLDKMGVINEYVLSRQNKTLNFLNKYAYEIQMNWIHLPNDLYVVLLWKQKNLTKLKIPKFLSQDHLHSFFINVVHCKYIACKKHNFFFCFFHALPVPYWNWITVKSTADTEKKLDGLESSG